MTANHAATPVAADRKQLPSFTLHDSAGDSHGFPTGRHALLVFVKEDCPTSVLSMPVIEAACRAYGDAIDAWIIGQESAGNDRLEQQFSLSRPMLDDSALKVSYAFDLDTVPTVILADGE